MKKLFLLFTFACFAIAGYGMGYHNCFQNDANVVVPLRADAQAKIDAQTGKEIIVFSVWISGSPQVTAHCSHRPADWGASVSGEVSNGRETYPLLFDVNNTDGPMPFIYEGAKIVSCSVSPSENLSYIFKVNYYPNTQ